MSAETGAYSGLMPAAEKIGGHRKISARMNAENSSGVVPRGSTEQRFDENSPHLNVAYDWTDDLMTYVS